MNVSALRAVNNEIIRVMAPRCSRAPVRHGGSRPPSPNPSPQSKATPQPQQPVTQLYRLVPVETPTQQTQQYQTVQLAQQPAPQYQTVQMVQQPIQQVQYVPATTSTFAVANTGQRTVVLGPGLVRPLSRTHRDVPDQHIRQEPCVEHQPFDDRPADSARSPGRHSARYRVHATTGGTAAGASATATAAGDSAVQDQRAQRRGAAAAGDPPAAGQADPAKLYYPAAEASWHVRAVRRQLTS